jgi:hypothetical protein
MDPITTAIGAAVTAGVATAGRKVVEASVADAYNSLKATAEKEVW